MRDNPFLMPWKIGNELGRLLVYPAARALFFYNRIPWGRGWRLYGLPVIQKHRRSRMEFGANLQLRSTLGSNPLGVTHAVILSTRGAYAVLAVGDDFAMSGGAISAAEKIEIGNRVAVGANSVIVDTDFHPLSLEQRVTHNNAGETAPVRIEDDVFIGMGCLVLKGVTIGNGSVIGAGSVVTRNIPPGVIAAGNPARVLREVG